MSQSRFQVVFLLASCKRKAVCGFQSVRKRSPCKRTISMLSVASVCRFCGVFVCRCDFFRSLAAERYIETMSDDQRQNETRHSMKRRGNCHDYCRRGTYMLTLVVDCRVPSCCLFDSLCCTRFCRVPSGKKCKKVIKTHTFFCFDTIMSIKNINFASV